MNQKTNSQFDGFRWACLLLILVAGLMIPSLIIFLLEITHGGIPPIQSLADITRRQFGEGDNLFLIAVFALIPFAALSIILHALSFKLTRLRFAFFSLCGFAGILVLMVPAHISVWRPLYTDEHTSSTAVIALLFIPFLCTLTMGVGIAVASLLSGPGWIREGNELNP